MRRAISILSLSLAVAGCGDNTTTDDGGPDVSMPVDQSMPPDTATMSMIDQTVVDLTVVPPDMSMVPDLTPTDDLVMIPDMTLPPDMTMDMTTIPPDMVKPSDLTGVKVVDMAGIPCGNNYCMKGEKCCVSMGVGTCAASCPDAAFVAACTKPADCMGNPCCINVTIMNMRVSNAMAMCGMNANDCPPAFTPGMMMGVSRGCTVDADCTAGGVNTNLNLCCTATVMGNPTHLCLNKPLAMALMGTCP